MDGMFPQDEHEAIARANEHVGIGEPGAFQNFLYGTGMYAARTATEAVKTLDLAGAVVPIMLDKLTGGTERQDQYFAENDRLQKVVDYFTPEPGEVGWASQALGSVAGGLPLIIAAPAIGIPALGMSSSADLIKEGVSPAVAGTVGAINSAALAVGLKIPFIGKTLSSQLASGMAGNWGLGVAATATSKAVLLGSENFKQAEELNPFDAKRQAMDVLMGAAFGTFAHLGMKAQAKVEAERDAIFTQATKDALLALNQAYHLEDVAMPGKSDNPFAINQGVKAVRQAMDQMLNDEPVNVEQITQGISVKPSPDDTVRQNEAIDIANKVANEIVVYHGSPHEFTEFDSSKIGTGEGAQAYGHGLYFAENPDVAKTYSMARIPSMSNAPEGARNEYKVQIPQRVVDSMLDWDKPLNEQSENVQEALKKHGPIRRADQNMTGEELMKQMPEGEGGPDAAADVLRQLGITGIKYLDAMSRDKGEGTRNYVLFDDKHATIIERNGETIKQKQNDKLDKVTNEIERRLESVPGNEVPSQGWKGILKSAIGAAKLKKTEVTDLSEYLIKNPEASKDDVLTFLKETQGVFHMDRPLEAQPKALAALNEITGTDNATLAGHQGLEAAITASGGETEALSKLAERGITNIRSEQPEGPLTIPTKPTPPPGSAVAAVPSDPIVDTVQRLIGENPDMLVPVGKDENSKTITMKASEYMAKATQDAEAAKTDAGVFRTAITCMLGML